MTNSKEFEKPSLNEVICEIRFDSNTKDPDWGKKIPNILFPTLSTDYPLFEVLEENPMQFGIGNQIISPIMHRFKYLTDNKQKCITITQNSFSFSIKPDENEKYSWKKYHHDLCKEWERIKGLLEVESIVRIGMRYINFLEIDKNIKPIRLLKDSSKYIPNVILENSNNFYNKSEYTIDRENKFIIYFVYRDMANTKEKKELIFDIDRFRQSYEIDNVLKVTGDLHTDIDAVFFESITDEYEKLMIITKK